jgi:hypothetical protein
MNMFKQRSCLFTSTETRLALATLALTVVSGCVIYVPADAPLQERQQTLSLPASELTTLVATTGAGNLTVVGSSTSTTVEVNATIYSVEEDDITLTLDKRGTSAVLTAQLRERAYANNRARIDLEITVPAAFALTLEDGSGNVDITGLQGDLDITEGSGELKVQGGHHVNVVDGSGNLSITDATGDVTVEDGSGHLAVFRTGGTVTIDDGSGDITVEQAGGLTIKNAGSGALRVQTSAR